MFNIKREGDIMMVIKYRALALLPGEGGGEDYKLIKTIRVLVV